MHFWICFSEGISSNLLGQNFWLRFVILESFSLKLFSRIDIRCTTNSALCLQKYKTMPAQDVHSLGEISTPENYSAFCQICLLVVSVNLILYFSPQCPNIRDLDIVQFNQYWLDSLSTLIDSFGHRTAVSYMSNLCSVNLKK